MNEGLLIHPMHLHGIPQLVFSKDGYNLASPYLVDSSISPPASATMCWWTATSRACGPITATSSRTPNRPRACSAW